MGETMENTYFIEDKKQKDGKGKIFLRKWKPENSIVKRGVVVIVHGLGEHSGRYSELAEIFNKIGFEVYCEDLPGFGKSYGKRGDIKDIDIYLSLIKTLYEKLLSELTEGQKIILYGHSMGGLLALWYLETYPQDFDISIISAPSLKPTKKVPNYLLFLSKLIKFIFPSFPFKNRIDANQLTDDEDIAEQYREDELTHSYISPRFFWQIEKVSREVMKNKDLLANYLKILFIHGADDKLVDYEDTKDFYESISVRDKSLMILKDVRHEPHKSSTRDHVFRAIVEWLEQRI